MNIFYLNRDPVICAKEHCDKHVVKMCIEYAQLLSTAHRVLDGELYYGTTKNGRKIKRWKHDVSEMEDNLMKASHVNHPSNIWTRSGKNNYNWLVLMWKELLKEYTLRYEKKHGCEKYIKYLENPPRNIPNGDFTDPPQAMPVDYKGKDAVLAYKKYYILDKSYFAKWKKRNIPEWFVVNKT
jgi:hypothetical protein